MKCTIATLVVGLALVVSTAWCSAAYAQESPAPETVPAEVLAIRHEAREVTGLYVAAGSLLGNAAILGVSGGLTLRQGDSIGFGAILLFAMPLPALAGLVLLALAAGEDAAVSRWNDGRLCRLRETSASDPARHELSDVISIVYGVGLGMIGLAGLGLIPIALLDGFHTPLYLIPTVVGGLGLLTILAGAGMDVTAGRWSGFAASLAPLDGGAMASISGSF